MTVHNTTFSEYEGIAAPAVAPAGAGRLYFDSTTQVFKRSLDGGPFLDLGITQEFIYRPTEPAPSGNVYADWATLVAALALIPGVLGVKVVSLDDSLAPIDLPPGAWDFGSYTVLRSARNSVLFPMVVTIEDGCTIDNVFELINLSVTSLTTTFVFDIPTADHPTYYLRENTQLNQTVAGGTIFRAASAGSALIWFFGVSAFSGAELCLDVTIAGVTVFVVANDIGRINQDTVAAVTGSFVRALIFSAGANFDENQAGLVDSGGILPKFILPRAENVRYDDFLVAPPLNLVTSNSVQEAIDTLKSKPIDALRFTGTLLGGVGPTSGFFSDPGPGGVPSQNPCLYPRGSDSGYAEIYVRVLAGTLATDANVTLFVEGAATPVTVVVPAGSPALSAFSTPAPIAQPIAVGQGVDIEVDTAAGGALNSLSLSVTLRLLP